MALFKISDVFTLTGRGEAVIGNILQGEIDAGDSIQLTDVGVTFELKVKSVESVRNTEDMSSIGLTFGHLSQPEKSALQNFKGKVVTVVAAPNLE